MAGPTLSIVMKILHHAWLAPWPHAGSAVEISYRFQLMAFKSVNCHCDKSLIVSEFELLFCKA